MSKRDRSGSDNSGSGRGQDDNHPEDRPATPAAASGSQGSGHGSGEDHGGHGADEAGDDRDSDDKGGGANVIKGSASDDSLSGTDASERLRGGDGADTLNAGAGADTLDGGHGADQLTGGAGADVFQIEGGVRTLAGLDRILDFSASEDRLVFDDAGPAATADTFKTATAADYDTALASANTGIAAGAHYVAVQVGADVIVFASEVGENHAESAVVLVGRTLTDISASAIG